MFPSEFTIFGMSPVPHLGIYERANYLLLDFLFPSQPRPLESNDLPADSEKLIDEVIKWTEVSKEIFQIFDGDKIRTDKNYGERSG